ncbi:hypothetical protein SPURM210S_01913 [Streptomyces purpurascens]
METSKYVARELDGVLEYLEDPAKGIEGMAEVAKDSPMPLATNMCVIAWEHLKPAVEQNAIQVLLTDHHYCGGCVAPVNWPPSARRSGSPCRCTPTRTWASASPR